MAFCQNHCHLQGRLGADPEAQKVGSASVLKFSLAIDDPKKNEDGTWDNNSSWADCEYWENMEGSAMGNVIRNIKKGQMVPVHAKYKKTRKENDAGEARYFISFRIRDVYTYSPKESSSEEGKRRQI